MMEIKMITILKEQEMEIQYDIVRDGCNKQIQKIPKQLSKIEEMDKATKIKEKKRVES